MKKAYVKPVLYAERFAIAEHISSCVYQTNFGVSCPIADAGVTFFTTTEIGCTQEGMFLIQNSTGKNPVDATVEDLIGMDITCYNALQDYHSLFNS